MDQREREEMLAEVRRRSERQEPERLRVQRETEAAHATRQAAARQRRFGSEPEPVFRKFDRDASARLEGYDVPLRRRHVVPYPWMESS